MRILRRCGFASLAVAFLLSAIADARDGHHHGCQVVDKHFDAVPPRGNMVMAVPVALVGRRPDEGLRAESRNVQPPQANAASQGATIRASELDRLRLDALERRVDDLGKEMRVLIEVVNQLNQRLDPRPPPPGK